MTFRGDTILRVLEIEVRNGRPHPKGCEVRLHRLPLVSLPWLVDRIDERDVCGRRKSPVTLKGRKRTTPPGNKGKRSQAEPPTPIEVKRLIDACGTHPAGVRDGCLVGFLWQTGCRIGCEALRMDLRDVNEAEGFVFVRCGKGAKSRVVPVGELFWELVAPWMEIRDRYPGTRVFCTVEGPTKGGPMGAPAFRTKLHRLERELGLTKSIRPHQMRHARACEMVNAGVELPYIQRFLGHSSPATTGVYLAGLPTGELFDRVRAMPRPEAFGEAA